MVPASSASLSNRIPETIIGLLTAGGEWEELAVVIASLARNRASLAIGNIVGSAISNILGVFSLGLLFHDKETPVLFDRSSRIYSLVLLVLTTFVTPIIYFSRRIIWLVCGSILIAFFAIYIGATQTTTSSDDESDDAETRSARADIHEHVTARAPLLEPNEQANEDASSSSTISASRSPRASRRKCHTLCYHASYLFLGFLAICLAGYVLSHGPTTITGEFGISDVLFGVVILAIATILPEKFVAVMSGHRGHAGILVANTAGSNIFLLALCSGIVMLNTSGQFEHGNANIAELGVLWSSTLAFTATVWFGGRFCRGIGLAMLIAYIAFIVLEFTVIHDAAGKG